MTSAIEFRNVDFSYPKAEKKALDLISMSIEQSALFAFLGPNGAGKTTLLRLICNRLKPTSGSIQISQKWCDASLALDPKKVGVLLENPGVYPRLSIEEYLLYFASLYQVLEPLTRIRMLLDSFDFNVALSEKMETLSLGNRQKVQIARALLHHPELLILDEPVANLDPLSRDAVWKALISWREKTGGTAIVCSHVLAELDHVATDYALISKGSILESGSMSSLTKQDVTVVVDLLPHFNMAQVKELLSPILKISFLKNGFAYSTSTPEVMNPKVISILTQAEVSIISVSIHKNTLADIYHKAFSADLEKDIKI